MLKIRFLIEFIQLTITLYGPEYDSMCMFFLVSYFFSYYFENKDGSGSR